MKEKDLIHLTPTVPQGCTIRSPRSELSDGYKPDLSIEDSLNRVILICEFETGTSRKNFLGGLIKAERYYDEKRLVGNLLIVLEEKVNTTNAQIANHLLPYFKWIKSSRVSQNGVSEVLIMTDEEYKQSIDSGEIILSNKFEERCKVISVKGLS